LLNLSDKNNVISYSQFGFKSGFGIADVVFALYSLSEHFVEQTKTFCC